MKWKNQLSSALSKWKVFSKGKTGHKDIVHDLNEIHEDLDGPPIVMIAGEFKSGKSTFVNAWLGEEVLTSDVTPATAVVTKLTYGKKKRVLGHFLNGEVKEYDEEWIEQLTAEREGRWAFVRKQLSYIEIQLPIEQLKTLSIVDSPGLNAGHDLHTDATERFLHRADYMIWVFSYSFVGLESEVNELKRIQALGIQPLGVVNRIDQHDMEEESIEEFLDHSIRRLNGKGMAFQGLYGVSAKEALEGMLESNATKMKWSNWHSLEKVFASFEENPQMKAIRIFERLKRPLAALDQCLIEEKTDNGFYRYQRMLHAFLKRDFPRIRDMRATLTETQQTINAEVSRVVKEEASLSGTQSFEELKQHFGTEHVDPFYIEFTEERERYEQEIEGARSEEKYLQAKWDDIKDSRFFGKSRVEQFGESMKEYNSHVDRLQKTQKSLKSSRDRFLKQLKTLSQEKEEQLRDPVQQLILGEAGLAQEWNQELIHVQDRYEEMDIDELTTLQTFLTSLKQWIEDMRIVFESNDEEIVTLAEFKECVHLYENIKVLDSEIPIGEGIVAYQKLLSIPPFVQTEVSFGKGINLTHLVGGKVHSPPTKLKYKPEDVLALMESKRGMALGIGIVSTVVGLLIAFTFQQSQSNQTESYEPISAETLSYEQELSLAEQWTQEDVEWFFYRMADEMSGAIEGSQQFYPELWFSEDGWKSFEQQWNNYTYKSYQERFELVDVHYSDDEIFVTTAEQYAENEVTWLFEGAYQLTSLGQELVITNADHELIERVEPDYPVTDEDLVAFLEDFRSSYQLTLNEDSFANIETFFVQEGTAYQELYDYVQSISGKGYLFQFTDFVIKDIERTGKNQYTILTSEELFFTDHQGQETRYEKKKRYIVQAFGAWSFGIDQITDLDTVREQVVVRTVNNVSRDQIASFISSYYTDFIFAFNGQGFWYVEEFYEPHGTEYGEAEQYIANANEKGMGMENLSFEIESIIELDDTHYLVSLYVIDRYTYRDGTGDEKHVSADYAVEITKDGLLFIDEIPRVEILQKDVFGEEEVIEEETGEGEEEEAVIEEEQMEEFEEEVWEEV
ncbi:dynamin family protein [Bacillus solitudinis]|uniref:dynamin family protein n=1 Tax=Bacillus solitudinis TaxID=2014074 RepID=UPI000C2358BE|nr:dynamin family protein [Bacillus solitudinis]